MLTHIAHLDAQLAATLVDVQPSLLESSPASGVSLVEVIEYQIVIKESGEVAVEEHQLLHIVDIGGFLGKSLVALYQPHNAFKGVGSEYRLDALLTQRCNFGSPGIAQVGFIAAELCNHRLPLLL